ncbi:hypothetical protein tb265_44870 [Gemmatimonadetes bacterium T265]|nr:hypothetical protein tb265_44870 [Gemmatimonadetes bacterium T265]
MRVPGVVQPAGSRHDDEAHRYRAVRNRTVPNRPLRNQTERRVPGRPRAMMAARAYLPSRAPPGARAQHAGSKQQAASSKQQAASKGQDAVA